MANGRFYTVKMPSGETRLILLSVWQQLVLFLIGYQLLVSGKAGRSRWLGRRPRTRRLL